MEGGRCEDGSRVESELPAASLQSCQCPPAATTRIFLAVLADLYLPLIVVLVSDCHFRILDTKSDFGDW